MEPKKCLNNFVLIRLDPEYNSVRLKNGMELYFDGSYEPEKNATVTGTIYGLPSHLQFTGEANNGMPWLTPMEVKMGDRVILYYLSVVVALMKQNERYVLEGKDRYILTGYNNIYAVVRDEKVIPVNGYCLIEPCEDPAITREKERMKTLGMELIKFNKTTKNHATYGIVRHLGVPNRRYIDEGHTDEGVDIAVGDVVVMKRTTDIPLQYDLHQTVNEGKKLLRVQRRNILGKL
jgi:hypothetical protein